MSLCRFFSVFCVLVIVFLICATLKHPMPHLTLFSSHSHFSSHTFTHALPLSNHSPLNPSFAPPTCTVHLSIHHTLLFHSACSPFTIHFTFYLPFPLFILFVCMSFSFYSIVSGFSIDLNHLHGCSDPYLHSLTIRINGVP